MEEYDSFEEFLAAHQHAEVHIVPINFSYGTCEECGDTNCARLPVGYQDMQVCAMCGQKYDQRGNAYLAELFEAHMRGHAAQWN